MWEMEKRENPPQAGMKTVATKEEIATKGTESRELIIKTRKRHEVKNKRSMEVQFNK